MANTAKNNRERTLSIPQNWVGKFSQTEPLHMSRARKDAIEYYQQMEVPTRVGHVWKHADAHQFIPTMSDCPSLPKIEIHQCVGKRTHIQYSPGGKLDVILSKQAEQAGVRVKELRSSNAHIGTVLPSEDRYFESLNQALWSSGVYLQVPDGVQLHDPVELSMLLNGLQPFTRIFIEVGDNSSLTLTQRLGSSSNHGKGVVVAEVSLGRGAKLHHGVIFDVAKADTLHYSHGCGMLERASMNMVATSVGKGRVKADISGFLNGNRAHSEIRTFAVSEGQTQLDFHTCQHHRVGMTSSDMKSQSVLLDQAVVATTGLIRIEEKAKDCEAYQIARNLMLSADAQATAVPELEIENNDVQCSHGAATGTLDAAQLFYLCSRGLSKAQATRLIVEGSLAALLQGFPDPLQQHIQDAHGKIWHRFEDELQ